jgi:hypothetical protein
MIKHAVFASVAALFAGAVIALEGIDPASWKDVTPAGEKFVIKMPGDPKAKKRDVPVPRGGNITFHSQIVEGKGYQFVLNYADYPPDQLKFANMDKMLDDACTSLRGAYPNGKPAGEKKVRLGSYPGREMVVEQIGARTLVARIFMVRNRMYQAFVIGPAVTATDADVRKFLDSLKVP